MNLILVLAFTLAAPPPAAGLRVPDGFEVVEYAGNELAPDITCITVDPKGRVVVAGRSYIRILVEETGMGVASRALNVTSHVKDAAHGLLWENDMLYAVVDGGLQRFEMDAAGDRAVGPPELVRKLKTGGEHESHALRRGPDGWLYLLCGNNANIDGSFATTRTSPIREPVAGCVVRFTPDFKASEIVADGFRNPYGFDFDPDGELFTFDSDNERCVSLPWYEGTRVYRVIPGAHHGWRNPQLSETWRCPPYFVDIARPVADMGRGSPTGVVCYRHHQFPAQYRGGLFCLDWTFGRIWYVPRTGFADENDKRPFLEATGSNGFAPTAAVIQPETGYLFVSIGGRGTRGAVYRIRWIGMSDPDTATGANTTVITTAYHLEWNDRFQTELPRLALPPSAPASRVRALVDLCRFREHFAWPVLRQVIEANPGLPATAAMIAELPPEQREELKAAADRPERMLAIGYGLVRQEPAYALQQAQRVLAKFLDERLRESKPRSISEAAALAAVRLLHLALGDLTAPEEQATVWAGYSPRRPLPNDRYPELRQLLRKLCFTGHHDLDRELGRTLALLEDDDPAALALLTSALTESSDPLDDVHHLIVLSRLRARPSPEQTKAVAAALLSLDEKIERRKRNRDRNWPLRIAELHAHLAEKHPALNDRIVNDPAFGRPDHVLFCRCPGFERRKAAEIFVRRSESNPSFAWNSELVSLLGELPAAQHLPIVRRLWERGGFEEAILPLLARSGQREDISRLLTGLTSPRVATVRDCLGAVERLNPEGDSAVLFALVRSLRLLPDGREGDALRLQVIALLRRLTGEKFGPDKTKWSDWLAKSHPEYAGKLAGPDGVDVAAWGKRLSGITWTEGDVERGRVVFAKASCSACHSGSQALGPDLSGIGGRFSRQDLFTAILQPSKDISPRYRTLQIDTTDGRTFQGLIVYEAVDGLILQTGPALTVRIAGDRIEGRRFTEVSMMPAGLIDKLTDREIADLYAFLQVVGKK
jgi:putative heme-binding domain-containing protein